MRRTKDRHWGASQKLLKTTYTTLIRPLIDYASKKKANFLKLERIQRSADRSITYWSIKTNTQPICKLNYDQIKLVDIRTRAWSLIDKTLLSSHSYRK